MSQPNIDRSRFGRLAGAAEDRRASEVLSDHGYTDPAMNTTEGAPISAVAVHPRVARRLPIRKGPRIERTLISMRIAITGTAPIP